MDRNEFKLWMEESKARQEEAYKVMKEIVAKDFPEIDFDACYKSGDNWELKLYPTPEEYILINRINKHAFKVQTMYGYAVEGGLEEDTVINNGNRITVISDNGGFATVRKYNANTGEPIKKVRYIRELYTNTKGKYIMENRRRIYLKEAE